MARQMNGRIGDFQAKIVFTLESWQHCDILLMVSYLQSQRKYFSSSAEPEGDLPVNPI